ncbi:tyrosine-type recombinase/integrase [Streptomyces platensis]|uniref:tyrosine-type recombinase/integrase n=1 Tax=Streptomyces platensis TaxID=58346 RepID=UPI00225BDCB2|nr:site-specific integrase [Streptomyces platensis]
MRTHIQQKDPSDWVITRVQRVVNICRSRRSDSLADVDVEAEQRAVQSIVRQTQAKLTAVYYTKQETKEAGFIELSHFGRHFDRLTSRYDLTGVPQQWLRDLLWEYLASRLRSPKCPRTRTTLDYARRACTELGSFLALDAPETKSAPSLLTELHAEQFVADLRHRAHHGLPSLGVFQHDGKPSKVTAGTLSRALTHSRNVLYWALESGHASRLGLSREFITSMPYGGAVPSPSRNPFTDDVARALSDEGNLQMFEREHDDSDLGLRDIWEGIVYTGRRCSEIIKLRLDCTARIRDLPMLWHDQTKVGNINEGVRIPERLEEVLLRRHDKTLVLFEHRHGRLPTAEERTRLALFPSPKKNPSGRRSLTYSFFAAEFRAWVDELDLGKAVTHQARHTLATKLLAHGATMAQIRRFLGQISERMAERYAKVAISELETVLQAVWVGGPASSKPGELLSQEEPLGQQEAVALALDLAHRSTPAEGGLCTYQPVVNGSACPWNLDCHNCDKFVLSGADLVYWRHKQEQWSLLAERAPNDATADYLHQVFEPTARAIAGLERALSAMGLLEDALALDIRRPQDYFHRVWRTVFRADDLAALPSASFAPPSEEL